MTQRQLMNFHSIYIVIYEPKELIVSNKKAIENVSLKCFKLYKYIIS